MTSMGVQVSSARRMDVATRHTRGKVVITT
jgi:hypothetical protein